MTDEEQGYLQTNTPQEILGKACDLISGARATQHGDYTVLHQKVASMWSAYLGHPVSGSEVAFCMALLKAARSKVGSYNEDDAVDGAAYTALWGALDEAEKIKGS
tara:strand:+ start:1595 stop:1909 length:315 start_codon:yes stop_codon:yes gene_type:complete